MFGKKYIEEEVKKKIDSMKQLDRIEFITRTNLHQSFSNTTWFTLLIFFINITILILGINFIYKAKTLFFLGLDNLGFAYGLLGIGTTSMSFITIIFMIFAMSYIDKKEKESKQRLETFLEEHSK